MQPHWDSFFPLWGKGEGILFFCKREMHFFEVHLFFPKVSTVEVKSLVLFSSHFHSLISPYFKENFKEKKYWYDLILWLCKIQRVLGISFSLSLILVLLSILPAVEKQMYPVPSLFYERRDWCLPAVSLLFPSVWLVLYTCLPRQLPKRSRSPKCQTNASIIIPELPAVM